MAENADRDRICENTRLTIPECCCRPCLEAQIRAHNPSAAAPEPRVVSSIPKRRAA